MRITDPTQRIQFRGFSVLPPNGPGWLVAPPIPTPPGPVYLVASFGKVLDHVGTAEIHTAGAEVNTWDCPSTIPVSPSVSMVPTPAPASAGEGGSVTIEPKSGLSFVSIPAGTFHYQDERRVSVKAFRLGASAVTVAAYKRCVDAGACAQPAPGLACNWGTDRTDHPINCVDWNQAMAFCKWIGGRLPADEEREYVASGGSEGRTYPWGNEEPGRRACWNGEGNDLGKGNRKTTCPAGPRLLVSDPRRRHRAVSLPSLSRAAGAIAVKHQPVLERAAGR